MNEQTNKEYQCFYLDPSMKLGHADDAEVLFETNDLGEACYFVYNRYLAEGKAIAVYQPRSKGYREIYRKRPHDGQPRGKNGKFQKRPAQ
jgi:hypothetical protein